MTVLPTGFGTPNGLTSALSIGIAQHPEWWAIALCLAAWTGIVADEVGGSPTLAFCRPAHAAYNVADFAASLGGWAIMVTAMMLPLVIAPVRRTARASLWRRRHRAIAGFLLGYGAVWLLFGVLALAVPALSRSALWAPAGAFAIATLWELTSLKRRALSLCHRAIPLRPTGLSSDIDCLRYGALQGRICIFSCWAMMLGPMLTAQRLPAMAGVAALCALERYRPRRRQYFEALALGAGAVGFAVAAAA
jgi:predicted metal-binding membrane protein